MKVEQGNDFGAVRNNTTLVTGVPWIDSAQFCDDNAVDIWIQPGGDAVHVIINEYEWPVLKARIDAVLAGREANV